MEVEADIDNLAVPTTIVPGIGRFALRVVQTLLSIGLIACLSRTYEMAVVSALRLVVAAAGLQLIQSFSMATTDLYFIFTNQGYNRQFARAFAIVDGCTTFLLFLVAVGSYTILLFFGDNLESCALKPCTQFHISVIITFITWFASASSFYFYCRLLSHLISNSNSNSKSSSNTVVGVKIT